jgi:hypothetical protein
MIAPTPLIKPRKNGNCQKVLDLAKAGVSFDVIGAKLGISERTARAYVRHYKGSDGRNYRGPEPRCACGLLLPCTCTGPMHAVDFLGRSGEPMACSSGLRAFGGGF